jgi:ATP-dependent Lhr-like helicase
VARWFARAFPGGPTPAQERAIPLIAEGRSVLLSSPTGTGKTLAGFLAILGDLFAREERGDLPARLDTIYVSPLKALANDVAKNLQAPLEGIEEELGWRPGRVRVALRTGETTPRERARMALQPPHVLVTTPESLALILLSPRWRVPLLGVRRVLVDEVHALAATKRGAHLALSLERLEARLDRPLQRIGMSATVRPLEEAAAFLAGGRPCERIAVTPPKRVELRAGTPHPAPFRVSGAAVEEALFGRMEETIARARSTIVFANTRHLTESVVRELRLRAGDRHGADDEDDEPGGLVAPHHGSMSKESRVSVEDRLRGGRLKCVVTSSSLELGIHAEAVDEVLMVGSPKLVARALQRVGRSGHSVGAEARGLMLAPCPDELAECAAVARLAAARDVEPLAVPPGGLDVLAQHLAALAAERSHTLDEALELTRRAWPYRELSREDADAVLHFLRDDARLVQYDGERFVCRSQAARIALARRGGTIPRVRLVRVFHGERFVGEVEEDFAAGLEPGTSIFQLAGERWRFVRPALLSIHVEPARGKEPTVPEWHAEALAASPQVLDEVR